MEINGPLIIAVQDDESSLKREPHLSFKPAFIQLNVRDRAKSLENYMSQLYAARQALAGDSPDREGMETVYQICDNLLEYIRSDEIDIYETIVIEIQPAINLSNFITGDTSIN